MGTINIHLNENQSLEWGQCSVGIKARSHSLISVLILNPRGDFGLLMAPDRSTFSQTRFILCGPVYFCVHQDGNLSINLARTSWCLKGKHTTEPITFQGSKTTNKHCWLVQEIDLLQESTPSGLHSVGKYCSCLWQTEQWLSVLWSTQAQLCLLTVSTYLSD